MYQNILDADIGNNIVCCNGKLICGVKNQIMMFGSIILFGLVDIGLWCAYVFMLFVEEIGEGMGAMCVISSFVYLFAIFGFYYHVQCFITEPGIIPRNYERYSQDVYSGSGTGTGSEQNQERSDLDLTRPRIYT